MNRLFDLFLTAVRDLQDPASGMFPNAAGRIDISATFMFSKILLNAGRELPRPDVMFDALLAAQRPDGTFTDRNTLGYHDMDAAFLLAHVAERRGYRRADARAALRRLADRVGEVWQRHGTFPGDPHQALAILSLAGVLKRALAPQNPPSSRAARFAPSQAAPGLRRNCRWRGKSDRLLDTPSVAALPLAYVPWKGDGDKGGEVPNVGAVFRVALSATVGRWVPIPGLDLLGRYGAVGVLVDACRAIPQPVQVAMPAEEWRVAVAIAGLVDVVAGVRGKSGRQFGSPGLDRPGPKASSTRSRRPLSLNSESTTDD